MFARVACRRLRQHPLRPSGHLAVKRYTQACCLPRLATARRAVPIKPPALRGISLSRVVELRDRLRFAGEKPARTPLAVVPAPSSSIGPNENESVLRQFETE